MDKWCKIKPKVNLIIDTLMFIVLMAVAGLGFLMKYVLLPGYKINEIYGSGTELFFWGLDRHQWGAIHLYLALSMVFLLVLHILFHWDMIVCIFRKMVPGRTARIAIAIFTGVIGFFLAIAPLWVNPEVAELQRQHNRNRATDEYGRGLYRQQGNFDAEQQDNRATLSDKPILSDHGLSTEVKDVSGSEPEELHHHNQVEIDGTMTLNQISERYNISVEELAAAIDVPSGYANERLGRLKRMYGFEMDDLRLFVINKTPVDEK